jgi:hypothetical protein
MSPALSAYLGRLVHPARKAYASAYADHLLTGSDRPEVPATVDADTAAKIARKVKRYAADTTPRTPSAAPAEVPDGLQHLPEAVRAYAAEHGDTELLGLVDAFTASTPGVSERLSDYYTPEAVPAFVETAEVDVLDLTDLGADHARALALKLARWNGGGGRVYSYRNGRRYLNRGVRRIDLNDATVQALPNYSDLVAVCQERGIHA